MQYLTEQLSRHVGEESLVLTTNVSAGTISSLTSTYGIGFLDQRSDIKEQFSNHCAENKRKHEKKYHKTEVGCINPYIKNQPNSSVKRKRSDCNAKQNVAMGNYSQSGLITSNPEQSIVPAKLEKTVRPSTSKSGVSYIGIEDVRTIQPDDISASQTEFSTLSENFAASNKPENCGNIVLIKDINIVSTAPKGGLTETLIASSDPSEENSDNVVVITEMSDDENSFTVAQTVKESNQLNNSDESYENFIVIRDEDFKHVGEDDEEGKPRSSDLRESMGLVPKVTDDIASVRNSYFDDSEPRSISKNIVDESGGSDIGGNSENTFLNYSQTAVIPESDETFGKKAVVHEKTLLNNSRDEDKRAKFNCNYCSQSFTTVSSQKRHERKHTGETPWACEYCDKRFYRKDDLNLHCLKHSGQKPHVCPICQTGFSKRKMLEAHVMVSHAVRLTSDALESSFSS